MAWKRINELKYQHKVQGRFIRIYKVKHSSLKQGKGWRVKYGEETLRTLRTKSTAIVWMKKWMRTHLSGW